MVRKFSVLQIIALLLLAGCGAKNSPPSPSVDTEISESKQEMVVNHQPSNKMMNIEGKWRSEVAPDNPMEVHRVPDGYQVLWEATLDADLRISGTVKAKDAPTFAGKVDFSSGDESGKEDLTLDADASSQTLWMGLPVMFSEPVPFKRVDATMPSCQELAEGIVTSSADFKALLASEKKAGIMSENSLTVEKTFDFRAYQVDENGETFTLARYRVNFTAKQLQKYDPAEDAYTAIEENANHFAGKECK